MEELLRKKYRHISVRNLLTNQKVPLDILHTIMETNDVSSNEMYILWSKQYVDNNFIEKYIHRIQWPVLSSNKESITADIIYKYGDKMSWI